MRCDIIASGAVLACALAWCSPAFALNPDLDVSQYAHTSWKIRDGFTKGRITSIAQTGLPEAVRSYCEQFSASSGVTVACDADDRVRDLSRGAALALFRIVQEALGNAAKHAHAARIKVRLTRSGDDVSLTVSDDGAGFDPGSLGTSGGLGLVMMRERATQLNGTFHFESAPGRGTTITVVIPFR